MTEGPKYKWELGLKFEKRSRIIIGGDWPQRKVSGAHLALVFAQCRYLRWGLWRWWLGSHIILSQSVIGPCY